jgi:hypothetical protein
MQTMGTRILFSLLIIFIFSFTDSAVGQVIASFDQKADYLLVDDEDYRTTFVLYADMVDFEYFADKANSMPETLSFTSQITAVKNYLISIKYIHKPELLYVKKILLFLGVEKIEIENTLYILQEFDPATL